MRDLLLFAFILVALYVMFEYGCDRGLRLPGVSWFDIQHEMRGTSKKAKGRMQQRKRRR
jgi:hypothetical protein